jgi:hypothetical protein
VRRYEVERPSSVLHNVVRQVLTIGDVVHRLIYRHPHQAVAAVPTVVSARPGSKLYAVMHLVMIHRSFTLLFVVRRRFHRRGRLEWLLPKTAVYGWIALLSVLIN